MSRIITLYAAKGERHFTPASAKIFGECDDCAAQHNPMLCEALPACREDTIWTEMQTSDVKAPRTTALVRSLDARPSKS